MADGTADIPAILARAETARVAGDWPGVLDALENFELSLLPPRAQINVLFCTALALHHVGRIDDSIARFGQALSIFSAERILDPQNPRPFLDYAQALALGARDKKALKNLLALRYPEFFDRPRAFKISPVANILAWCRSTGITITELDPGGQITTGGDAISPTVWRYEVLQAWSVAIPGAEIIAGWDYVIAPTGEVLEGGNYMPVNVAFPFMPHACDLDLAMMGHVWTPDAVPIDADVLFVGTPERHVFGHWLNDFLPRLRAWRGPGQQKVAIPVTLPQKHRDLLARFGVRPSDLIECALGQRYRFRTLTVAYTGSDRRPQPQSLHFVRDTLARPAPSRPMRKYFMVREAGTRRPANTAELDQVLAAFAVEKVNPAKWSLAEQERLLAETSVIVAVYGTELLCMYHLPKGADVIEISANAAHREVFGPKSSILGLRHHFVACELFDPTGEESRKFDRDLIVDCDALRCVLKEIAERA